MSGVILLRLFEIKNKICMLIIAGLLVTFPAMTSLIGGFLFTAPYYLFALFLSTMGCYLICRHKNAFMILTGIFLVVMALGIYQPYLAYVMSVLITAMFKEVSEKSFTWKQFFSRAIYYTGACIISIGLYLLINNLILTVLGLHMDNYKGMNTYNMTDIRGYYWRVRLAYSEFFAPSLDSRFSGYNMYRGNIRFLYYGILCWNIVLCIKVLHGKNILQKIQCIFILLGFPAAINAIFIIADRWSVYSLMMYSQVMIYIFAVWLMEKVSGESEKIDCQKRDKPVYYFVGIILSFLVCIGYWRYDNICYLKAEMMQSEMDSWLTVLISEIRNVDGYNTDMPVVFLNADKKSDSNWPQIEEFSEIEIEPFVWEHIVNDNSWIDYMKYRCGYAPEILSSETWENDKRVQNMAEYPNDGSIEVIDGIIVVKF